MNIDKKFILNIMVITAIASTILACILPYFSFNLLDVYKNYEDTPRYPWEIECSLLTKELRVYDNTGNNKELVYESYQICIIYNFETGELPTDLKETKEDSSGNYFFPSMIFFLIVIVPVYILINFFAYFSIKSFKDCGNKKTKYFLYAGITLLIIVLLNLAQVYNSYSSLDVDNLGYVNSIKFEYGFYLLIMSIILFFTAYFTQDYLVDFGKESENTLK